MKWKLGLLGGFGGIGLGIVLVVPALLIGGGLPGQSEMLMQLVIVCLFWVIGGVTGFGTGCVVDLLNKKKQDAAKGG